MDTSVVVGAFYEGKAEIERGGQHTAEDVTPTEAATELAQPRRVRSIPLPTLAPADR